MNPARGTLLVVDDTPDNRILLLYRLQRQGHTVVAVENGRLALAALREQAFDIVLLDVMMPELNGYETLECIKTDASLRHIPVVMISAIDDLDSIVRCIELGAEDYLFKPFNSVLLKARVDACLEKKRFRDQEQAYMKLLEAEREKAEALLLNILPAPIAARLKQTQSVIADRFESVTVLFADIVNFSQLSTHISPEQLVNALNDIFSTFDHLAAHYGLEKIKTIGDAYMVVGGLLTPQANPMRAILDMALAMQEAISAFRPWPESEPFSMRIGIHNGPAVAGVIGTSKFSYDLWGDTVNIASRMESHGLPGAIQVTATIYEQMQQDYEFQARGLIDVKGWGEMPTYLLLGPKTQA